MRHSLSAVFSYKRNCSGICYIICSMGGGDLPDMYVCMSTWTVGPRTSAYRIAGFFKGEYFHEFYKSSSIRENFTCEKFEISTAVQ